MRSLSIAFVSCMLCTVFIAGCGGGADDFMASKEESSCDASTSQPAVGELCARRAAQAALPTGPAPRQPDATALFDWAETAYPAWFPGNRENRTSGRFIYRYYPETGNYIGVNGSGVWAMGPMAGNPMIRTYLGELSDFSCSVFPSSCAVSSPPPDRCAYFYRGDDVFSSTEPLVLTSGAFTTELWVVDLGDPWADYFMQGDWPNPFQIGTDQDRKIRVGPWATGVAMPSGRWVHLAVTVTASGFGTLYVDGAPVASKANAAGLFSGASMAGLRIGAGLTGCIDDLKVWKVARTATQIQADMNKGSTASDDLLAHFSFDEAVERARVWQSGTRGGHVLSSDYTLNLVPAADAPQSKSLAWSNRAFSSTQNDGFGLYLNYYQTTKIETPVRGVSFYSAVWPMSHDHVPQLGLGMISTWIGRDITSLLGTPIVNKLPTVSVEGGAGHWGDLKFRSALPKWRFGITPDGYKSMYSSPGWAPGGSPSPMSNTGLVQLSNRIVEPPEGFNFRPSTFGELVGVAWMALPWPSVAPTVPPTGTNAWTLFLNTANFKGPVAYILPQAFSAPSLTNPELAGLSIDSMSAWADKLAMEVASLPMVSATVNGTTYSRIPKIDFPVDATGRTVLARDFKTWSSAGIETPFADWLAGRSFTLGPFASGGARNIPLSADIKPVYQSGQLVAFDQIAQRTTFENGNAFGLQWSGSTPGRFPEYFRSNGTTREVSSAAEAPSVLNAASFTSSKVVNDAYLPPDPDWWAPAAGVTLPTGWARMADGSVVTYRWYRFVDQPALRRLNLTQAEKDLLQNMVTRLHQVTTREWMPAPSGGTLAALDDALLVKPPPGYEYGYVPIAISQYGRTLAPELPRRP